MEKHIHGGDVYHHVGCVDFSANCNPLGTPENIKKAIIESLEHINEYPLVGCAPLKEAIAEYEEVKPEQVVCGNGAADVIFSLCRALSPKKALVPAPTFAEYQQALYSVGCQVDFFMLEEEKDFLLDEGFIDVLTEDTDVIFLCNPNNPTGLLVERTVLEKILDRCDNLGIFMVVDECFLDFVPEPERYTLKDRLDRCENLFLLKAFTKRYAMAGVRLGYGLCGNYGLLEKMENVCQPWNVSSMAQAAGMAALKEREYVKAGRKVTFEELAYLKKELEALGYPVFPSQANYVFFRGPSDLYEQLEKKKILIRDCSNYTGLSRGYFRVAVKSHLENQLLIRALKELEQENKDAMAGLKPDICPVGSK